MNSIKTMGLITAMALALAAFVGIAPASAAIFEVPGAGSEVTTKWNGVPAGKSHALKFGSDSFKECSGLSLLSGEMKGESASELSLSLSPEFKCFRMGFTVNLKTGTCKFRLNPGTGSGNPIVGTLDIVGCTKPITFESPGCYYEIGNQNGLGSVTYTRSESEGFQSVKVAASLTGITYTQQNGGNCNSGHVGNGTFSDGTYTGEWTVRPAHFSAESAPAYIKGTKSTIKIFGFAEVGSLTCQKFESTGEIGTVNSESAVLTANALSGCSGLGESTTASMGGCSFRYTGSGGFQVVGATCATNPITVKNTLVGQECTITVGPQALQSGLTMTNEGSGNSRVVQITAPVGSVKSVQYTAAGPHCVKTGTFSNGAYKQSLSLSAITSMGGSQGLWIE